MGTLGHIYPGSTPDPQRPTIQLDNSPYDRYCALFLSPGFAYKT